MRHALLLLGIASSIGAALADRGSATANPPNAACNTAPDQPAAPTQAAAPSCEHAADPDGAMGLCPNLADNGWCDCGSAGDYPILAGSNICGYTSLDSASKISLSTTNCVSSTVTQVITETVVPVPVTTGAAAKRDEATTAAPARRGEPTPSSAALRRRVGPNRLDKRGGTVTFSNCDGAPPSGSSYKSSNGFPTMKSVLQQAYADAVTLAKASQDVAADNLGFTHYFGGIGPDIQLTHFKAMMAAIASSDNNYAIQFECKNTPSCSGKQSAMVTDATVGSATDVKTIEVCDRFWTSISSKYLLYNSAKTSPTPPYRDITASGSTWCAKSGANSFNNNQFFATAGHTVLHELTHLDSLATKAGLEGDDDVPHGTEDAQLPKECELAGARSFLERYTANPANTMNTSPDYNAESYAAAATEIYFMNLCGFTQIKPTT